ncbi:SAF domain-containing protein [Oceanobacter sp. 4_MG-2023]|uniref:SAF domain-containing protein n=1 Tax=Oceanobacter sp. 4_MG-2023 TaxID=3062623 RepID=UPI002734026D|nr:SAF domain-containing protein [Oceanobacter sp. 4_MG-2023]MDP2548761.1 SAF domain-containing protein [Oceanobacter sp. 4_MG-2023]
MKRRLNGSAIVGLTVFSISALLTAVLGYRQIDKMNYHTVLVANQTLTAGTLVTENTLTMHEIEKTDRQALDASLVVGKVLKVAKQAGMPFYFGELAAPDIPTLSERLADNRVLYTLTVSHGSIPVSQIQSADRFDVLVKNAQGVRKAASNIRMVGSMKALRASAGKSGNHLSYQGDTTLVISILPEEVYPLAAINNSDTVSLVLHNPATAEVATQAVWMPTAPQNHTIDVYSGLTKKTVIVHR